MGFVWDMICFYHTNDFLARLHADAESSTINSHCPRPHGVFYDGLPVTPQSPTNGEGKVTTGLYRLKSNLEWSSHSGRLLKAMLHAREYYDEILEATSLELAGVLFEGKLRRAELKIRMYKVEG
ncbi:MAG: hypothetical protein M1827_004376 [Pycnora praestabilis]|nr:MAG: hypothetical protein M1827_004376 [Pycnora praestabilis]